MREAIGGTWLFNLVIFFVLLFAGYMCLSINYTRAFNVKDKIINEIERNGGIYDYEGSGQYNALKSISQYIKKVGYMNTGNCKDYEYGCNRDGVCTKLGENGGSKGYSFCISEVKAGDDYYGAIPGEFYYVSYYRVKVFYHLDLPVIRSAFQFSIKGDTKLLYRTDNKHD